MHIKNGSNGDKKEFAPFTYIVNSRKCYPRKALLKHNSLLGKIYKGPSYLSERYFRLWEKHVELQRNETS